MSALPHEDDALADHPPMAPDVLAWRKQFEDAIEDGSFRSLPSARKQSAAIRNELGLPKH